MKVKVEKLELIIEVLNKILVSHKKFEKNRDAMADFDKSQKYRDKARNIMETEAEYIEDMHHELHCLCVESGLADYNQLRYNDKIISSSNGWSSEIKTRRKPKI